MQLPAHAGSSLADFSTLKMEAIRSSETSVQSTTMQLPAHAGSSLADFSTLKMEAIRFSETSVQSTTSTRRHTSEDGILHSHRCENLKSYNIVLISVVDIRAFFGLRIPHELFLTSLTFQLTISAV
jgi:hypothetical protein